MTEKAKEDVIPWKLNGSCHCGKVTFSLDSFAPYPYNICHCNTCTKTAGFFSNNIMGEAKSFQVKGMEFVKTYRAKVEAAAGKQAPDDGLSTHERKFCTECGSALWAFDKRYSDWVYPYASAIDTPLPEPPERNHIMIDFKKPWIIIPPGEKDHQYARYPNKGIEQWHRDHNIYGKSK